MSTVTESGRLLTNEVGISMVNLLHEQNSLIRVIAADKIASGLRNVAELKSVIESGEAQDIFDIGDRVILDYTENNVEYEMPFNIVHFGNAVLEDGEERPGMVIQAHYTTPSAIVFDAAEAMKYFPDGLPAGTYHFTSSAKYGTGDMIAGGSYQFTLTKEIPAGGQICGPTQCYDKTIDKWTIKTYASASDTTEIETVPVTSGSGGTDLGDVSTGLTDDTNINVISRIVYGSNRYRDSYIRQWLNADTTGFWTPQHNFDRPIASHATHAGWMAGLAEDFKALLRNTKVQVAVNTVTDGGETDVMYDKFFLPSLEEMNISPQASGIEGPTWEYWQRVLGRTTKWPTGTDHKHPGLIHYGVENKATRQTIRLRSAYRGNAYYVWHVASSGYAHYYYATYAYRATPACWLC